MNNLDAVDNLESAVSQKEYLFNSWQKHLGNEDMHGSGRNNMVNLSYTDALQCHPSIDILWIFIL